jgi:hypothetical protein
VSGSGSNRAENPRPPATLVLIVSQNAPALSLDLLRKDRLGISPKIQPACKRILRGPSRVFPQVDVRGQKSFVPSRRSKTLSRRSNRPPFRFYLPLYRPLQCRRLGLHYTRCRKQYSDFGGRGGRDRSPLWCLLLQGDFPPQGEGGLEVAVQEIERYVFRNRGFIGRPCRGPVAQSGSNKMAPRLIHNRPGSVGCENALDRHATLRRSSAPARKKAIVGKSRVAVTRLQRLSLVFLVLAMIGHVFQISTGKEFLTESHGKPGWLSVCHALAGRPV